MCYAELKLVMWPLEDKHRDSFSNPQNINLNSSGDKGNVKQQQL